MSDPYDPYDFDNPPGWTDPYDDIPGLEDDTAPPLQTAGRPPTTPPGSPLLTGLIIGLLLVALSVAVFQLLRPEDDGTAGGTTTTTEGDGTTTTTTGDTTTTTAGGTTTTLPDAGEYPAVGDAIPVSNMKLITTGIRIQDDAIPDLAFGSAAADSVGRLTASFGPPDSDTGWQVSTGQWGVCEGDLERVVFFGPLAAIVTLDNNEDTFNGYRQDLSFGNFDSPAVDLETLSGLKAGDTVGRLKELYSSQTVTFSTDSLLGDIFELRGADSGELLLWGPVRGTSDQDLVIGIYAPNVCER